MTATTHRPDAARTVWRRQYTLLHHILAPWVLTLSDGSEGLDPEAPADLVGLYGRMQQVGYAHGWL